MTKAIVFVPQGVCAAVWSTKPIDVEVIDLDGDHRVEGKARLAALEIDAESHPDCAEYKPQWP